MRAGGWVALLFLVAGCSPGRSASTLDAGPIGTDAGLSMDAPPRVDAPGGADAPSIDAPRTADAPSSLDAGRDAPALDAGRDAAAIDAPPSDAGAITIVRCAPPVPSGATAGIVLSPAFWSGFRFPVASAGRITRVGLDVSPSGAGTIFAAVVRLSGMSDQPDDPALTSSDVLGTVTLPVSAAPTLTASAPIDVAVTPGWYAVVFGSGAFGATLASASIPSAGGGGCRSLAASDFPFTIRQSDGMFILQGAEPHLFVELSP